ncbi:MAG: hypothetical protein A2745_01195 [Candidatus Harrisonbacteria bacterium RIFCSPHIGHO2_01_FULL_44_13]|uniref:histidine kinase n=1 Tax=Candidatus Harrisonbacteria bacterium RIFCSPLOWO2_01_FULL_44_18 TaxID=1798407 RepID=A0A1G1ZM83_9BACT|nr:MAG: hypothetical protein A2745_01195 [Candidatus Harrisonbacteria bacterium RIFCSPHIGHO2_01_FULL_44_13]OGY65702.1 MAG: hypothetical protein A3A16_03745 [Candidatus Harrisonbacteria bacterium RIFCSPLOWO2_01_FULL_44_18]
MFQRFWSNFKIYATLPEMRVFWVFLFLVLAVLIIDFIYLPFLWSLISLGIFLAIGVIIIFSSLRSAKANLNIKIEHSRFESIIGDLRDGVVAYDQNFKILVFNRAAEEIFNLKAAEVIGKYFSLEQAKEPRLKLLVQTFFPSLAPAVVRRSEAGVYPQVIDLSFDQPVLDLRITTNRVADNNGQVLGFVKVARDRTRDLELLRSKSEFITLASRQLRTPLTAANWVFESLKKESLTDSQQELVNSGSQATGKLLKIVNDLLDVAKIEEGRFGYNFQNINIVDFLEKIIGEASAIAGKYNVKIYFDRPAEAINIFADTQKLGVAVSHLLDNAIRYNISNGRVDVKLQKLSDRPYIQISVKDTGVGIPEEDMQKLFTKFFRGENITKLSAEGSGLGLYIVKNIIRRHGGNIRAESVLDRGSAFYFTLPTDLKLVPSKEIVYGEE